MTEFQKRQVLYVTLNRALKRQVESKIKILSLSGFDVIESAELWEYIDLEYFFVFDEYHTALVDSKVE
jgi:hypothetical protein